MRILALLALFCQAVPAHAGRIVFEQAFHEKVFGVCVHPTPGPIDDVQIAALRQAKIKRIRMTARYDQLPDLPFLPYAEFQILAIMGEEPHTWQAFNQDPEEFIRRYVEAAPYVPEWQFFNEPDNFARISAGAYVAGLRTAARIFAQRYPKLTLVAACPVGIKSGAKYFDQMVKAGLLSIPNIVISAHQYGVDPGKYKAARGRRIFITETGAKWDKQMDWLEDGVPDTLKELRPERLYWYVNWEAQDEGRGFGWITIDQNAGTFRGSRVYDYFRGAAQYQR